MEITWAINVLWQEREGRASRVHSIRGVRSLNSLWDFQC